MTDILTILMCLAIGIILMILGRKSIKEVPIFMFGLIFTAIGILAGYQNLFGASKVTEIILVWLLCGSFGGSMLYAGVYGIYEKIFLCTKQTMATIVEIHTAVTQKRHRIYYPVATYYVNKKKYKTRCDDSFGSEKRLMKRYEIGKEYPAYVSVKNPRRIVLNRKNIVSESILIIWGIVILSIAVVCTVK